MPYLILIYTPVMLTFDLNLITKSYLNLCTLASNQYNYATNNS